MGIVTDEQKEKRPGQFIKLEDKAVLAIYSHLYKATTHFLRSQKTSVICKGEDECYFCQMNLKPRVNYFYFGDVSGDTGVIQVPASVFYAINDQERVLDMDKRESLWVISKKGSGLNTEYGVARGKDAGKAPVTLEEATEKLTKVCDSFVKNNEQRYSELVAKKVVEAPQDEENINPTE